MSSRLNEEYNKSIKFRLKESLNLKSIMQVPKLEKIVLNVGIGDAHSNKTALSTTIDELSIITGQKAVKTVAKKSISNFKIREGYDVGCRVTLRGDRMYEFLDRLINVSLPRVRDFRGLSSKSFDAFGNYNLSIKEQIIFPEIDFDKVDKIHGINITIVTTGKNKKEGKALLDEFRMPFKD
ncbi:MAG: 50S ribosomal protein L5 [Spirochaetota bacterium]|nr:50S ribosomal protein L5 [Spirochaetota bacterium]